MRRQPFGLPVKDIFVVPITSREPGLDTLKFLIPSSAIVILLLLSFSCGETQATRQTSGRITETKGNDSITESRPDPKLTPGDVLEVTREDICTPGYAKKVRDVPGALKKRIYQSYGRSREKDVCCEVDHLIPLELGGSNRPSNLWPELYNIEWNARVKDRIETRLHNLVCSGELDLGTAQKAIAKDWIAAYQQYEGVEPYRGRHKRRQ